MAFQIVRNDITKVAADVIVNTANPKPRVGSGTDSAIYRAAGEQALLAERKKIGAIERGACAVTPAFGLQAKYIIHTVGPEWEGGSSGEREILHACYRNSLEKAAELEAESIAFPLIATGVYGFPKDEALSIALEEIQKVLLGHEMKVILVVFDESSFQLSSKIVDEIDQFIDEHAVGELREEEYPYDGFRVYDRLECEKAQSLFEDAISAPLSAPAEEIPEIPDTFEVPSFSDSTLLSIGGKSLDDLVIILGKTFQERLFELIDASGMEDVAFYKKSLMGTKNFSKMKGNVNYQPSKITAVRCALALELDMPTTMDLLSRAGIALSPSSKFDLVISYFITNKMFNTYWQDTILCKYGLQPLWSEE